MNFEERERMKRLGSRIADEKDPLIFAQLVAELNALLKAQEERIRREQNAKAS